VDPIETRDWLQAIESVIREEGVERAQYLIDQLLSEARKGGVKVAAGAGAATTSTLLPLKMNRNTRAIWIWNVVSVLRSAGTPS
jgi:pyruvate dehydrogenase E1 component